MTPCETSLMTRQTESSSETPPADTLETCAACHREYPPKLMMLISGRRLCVGCASAIYMDEDEEADD